jgi:hypothetical protein
MHYFGLTAAWVRASLMCLLVAPIAGCGSSTAPSQNLNLTGTWAGVVGSGSGGGRALRVTWTASQSGSRVSGPATLLTSPAVTDQTFSGTMSGSLSGGASLRPQIARAMTFDVETQQVRDSLLADLDAFERTHRSRDAQDFETWLSRTIAEHEQWLARIIIPKH